MVDGKVILQRLNLLMLLEIFITQILDFSSLLGKLHVKTLDDKGLILTTLGYLYDYCSLALTNLLSEPVFLLVIQQFLNLLISLLDGHSQLVLQVLVAFDLPLG